MGRGKKKAQSQTSKDDGTEQETNAQKDTESRDGTKEKSDESKVKSGKVEESGAAEEKEETQKPDVVSKLAREGEPLPTAPATGNLDIVKALESTDALGTSDALMKLTEEQVPEEDVKDASPEPSVGSKDFRPPRLRYSKVDLNVPLKFNQGDFGPEVDDPGWLDLMPPYPISGIDLLSPQVHRKLFQTWYDFCPFWTVNTAPLTPRANIISEGNQVGFIRDSAHIDIPDRVDAKHVFQGLMSEMRERFEWPPGFGSTHELESVLTNVYGPRFDAGELGYNDTNLVPRDTSEKTLYIGNFPPDPSPTSHCVPMNVNPFRIELIMRAQRAFRHAFLTQREMVEALMRQGKLSAEQIALLPPDDKAAEEAYEDAIQVRRRIYETTDLPGTRNQGREIVLDAASKHAWKIWTFENTFKADRMHIMTGSARERSRDLAAQNASRITQTTVTPPSTRSQSFNAFLSTCDPFLGQVFAQRLATLLTGGYRMTIRLDREHIPQSLMEQSFMGLSIMLLIPAHWLSTADLAYVLRLYLGIALPQGDQYELTPRGQSTYINGLDRWITNLVGALEAYRAQPVDGRMFVIPDLPKLTKSMATGSHAPLSADRVREQLAHFIDGYFQGKMTINYTELPPRVVPPVDGRVLHRTLTIAGPQKGATEAWLSGLTNQSITAFDTPAAHIVARFVQLAQLIGHFGGVHKEFGSGFSAFENGGLGIRVATSLAAIHMACVEANDQDGLIPFDNYGARAVERADSELYLNPAGGVAFIMIGMTHPSISQDPTKQGLMTAPEVSPYEIHRDSTNYMYILCHVVKKYRDSVHFDRDDTKKAAFFAHHDIFATMIKATMEIWFTSHLPDIEKIIDHLLRHPNDIGYLVDDEFPAYLERPEAIRLITSVGNDKLVWKFRLTASDEHMLAPAGPGTRASLCSMIEEDGTSIFIGLDDGKNEPLSGLQLHAPLNTLFARLFATSTAGQVNKELVISLAPITTCTVVISSTVRVASAMFDDSVDSVNSKVIPSHYTLTELLEEMYPLVVTRTGGMIDRDTILAMAYALNRKRKINRKYIIIDAECCPRFQKVNATASIAVVDDYNVQVSLRQNSITHKYELQNPEIPIGYTVLQPHDMLPEYRWRSHPYLLAQHFVFGISRIFRSTRHCFQPMADAGYGLHYKSSKDVITLAPMSYAGVALTSLVYIATREETLVESETIKYRDTLR